MGSIMVHVDSVRIAGQNGERIQSALPSRRDALIGSYLIAAVLGYFWGGLQSAVSSELAGSSALARVGLALQRQSASGWKESPAQLAADIERVRADFTGEQRNVFDLVVALRGLANQGHSEWHQAEALCRGLKWPRCDRPALEEMKRRSTP
jgi:hypothetical protein